MVNFELAKPYMINSLKNIWKECFHESKEFIDYFFDSIFEEESTAVCTLSDEPIAMVYMLDNFIIESGGKIPSCYLYAVGTLPNFQRRGYMKGLLSYAEDVAMSRGKRYATLFPAERQLCKFYENLGYRDFFKARLLNLKREEMSKFCLEGDVYSSKLKIDDIFEIRCRAFNKDGSVYWNKKVFEYACNSNKIYGSKILSYGKSYAICRKVDDEVQIIESVLRLEDLYSMMSLIHKEYNADSYVFRFMDITDNLGGNMSTVPFGMIKPLDKSIQLPSFKDIPYIGLVLD